MSLLMTERIVIGFADSVFKKCLVTLFGHSAKLLKLLAMQKCFLHLHSACCIMGYTLGKVALEKVWKDI